MNELLRFAIAFILVVITLTAFLVVLSVLFARRVSLTRAVAESMPGRAFLLGLVNFVFFSALAFGVSVLSNLTHFELLNLLALLSVLPPLVGAGVGIAGLAQIVGEQLAPQGSGSRSTIWGAVTLSLACALPFLGWFGLLPYVVMLGLGSFILSFTRPEQVPARQEFSPPDEAGAP